ncbi:cell division control protein [Canna indica]|uniref:Cell division control protein n=1 Tax=Canna indica TaxID=4628 RepID=A0AAQ3JU28_9LILI|nr:cell division control protein [Canna indica]
MAPKLRSMTSSNGCLAVKLPRGTTMNGDSTPSRKRSRSECASENPIKAQSPNKRRSPRRCNSVRDESRIEKLDSPKSPRKSLFGKTYKKPKWNPRDPIQMQAVKQALHVATQPDIVVCREEEQNSVLEFCKSCIQQNKAGSLYVCGCPGTGKTLSIGKVQGQLLEWSKEIGLHSPDVLTINCTYLTKTSEIFNKMLTRLQPSKKITTNLLPLQHLQKIFSQKSQPLGRMMLMVVDEIDFLVTKDHSVLHDLFMLTTLPYSRCILIGIANTIDLTDRLLPNLGSLHCKPIVITFCAYSKDQILKIIQQRLMVVEYDVFELAALEFCARKVAAASGDVRKALDICRNAIEVLEAELRGSTGKEEIEIVSFDHMNIAITKSFKSPMVDIIQSLPQHQQVILCSLVRLFRQCKRNATTLEELNRSYLEICKSTQIRPVEMMEFTDLCSALSDQGLLDVGKSKGQKLKNIKLKVDSSDITFALKGIRFFRNCLG